MKGMPFLLVLRLRLWRRRVLRVVVTMSRHHERPVGVHSPAGYLRKYKLGDAAGLLWPIAYGSGAQKAASQARFVFATGRDSPILLSETPREIRHGLFPDR